MAKWPGGKIEECHIQDDQQLVASEMVVSVPFSFYNGTMLLEYTDSVKLHITGADDFPDGLRYRIDDFQCSTPFSPMAISMKPTMTANTSTWKHISVCESCCGLDGIKF